jgi:transcriptional regulator with XRE-family HTH domain
MGETLGERLREFRLRAGLTQEDLASRSGVLIGTVRNWEQGSRSPEALLILYRLAQALSLPMEDFVKGLPVTEAPAPERPRGRPRKGQDADLPPAQEKPARRKPPRPRGG